jgi:hypothetical protein
MIAHVFGCVVVCGGIGFVLGLAEHWDPSDWKDMLSDTFRWTFYGILIGLGFAFFGAMFAP